MVNRRVEVIAHKGLHNSEERGAPENTIAAVNRAIECGADWVEFDVRTTADGVLVVIHDETVDRTSNGHGEVIVLTLEELKQLDFCGEKIPTLEETLVCLRGRAGAYLEVKDAEPAAVIEQVRRHDMLGDTVIYARTASLEAMRVMEPAARLMVNRPPRSERELRSQYALIHPEVYGSSSRDITVDQVYACHNTGAVLWVNSMAEDHPDGWRRLVEMGADALETDRPVACIGWLTKAGYRI